MFDISDTLFVLSLLFKFMLPVAVGVLVRSCVGIKHSYIQIIMYVRSAHPRSRYTQCLIWHRLGRLMTARLVLHHLQVVVQALHRRHCKFQTGVAALTVVR